MPEGSSDVGDRVLSPPALPVHLPGQVMLLDRPCELHRLVKAGSETPLLVGFHAEVIRMDQPRPRHERGRLGHRFS